MPPSAKRRCLSVPLDSINEYDAVPDGDSYELPQVVIPMVLGVSGSGSEPSSDDGEDPKEPQRTGPLPPDTPRVNKKELNRDEDADVDAFRKAVLADIGTWVKELPGWSFAKELLPPLDPALNLDDVIRVLKTGPNPVLGDNGWTLFANPPPVPPGRKSSWENTFYAPLVQIIADIIKNAPSTRRKCLHFEQRPNDPPLYTYKSYTGMPDGQGVLVPPDGILLNQNRSWDEIIFTAEYKKKGATNTESRNKNIMQLCGNLSQTMRDDPARRFTYGITMEKFDMRLWYCDRSEVVVSESFNIMESYDLLVHFVLSIAYPESLWDLGFDTTMTRAVGEDEGQYIITVPDQDGVERKYLTLQLLDNHNADALRGRGTRVWKAVELVDGERKGNPVAIKDAWIDSDRTREGYLMKRILEDLSQDDREKLRPYLLTVLCHGDVISPSGVADTTRVVPETTKRFIMRALNRNQTARLKSQGESRRGNHAHIFRHPGVPKPTVPTSRRPVSNPMHKTRIEYDQKTHYRIVFKEVGTPIVKEVSFNNAFYALFDACLALLYIHKAGWVHRDVSSSNILWINDTDPSKLGRGKLVDLEYAKKEDDASQHLIQTATPFFMAVEVRQRNYRFFDNEERGQTPMERDPARGHAEQHTARVGQSTDTSKTPRRSEEANLRPFRYMKLHDIESVWWIAVYLLFYRGIHPDDRPEDLRELQDSIAAAMFENTEVRSDVFHLGKQFASYIDKLHPSVQSAGYVLESIRVKLNEAYKETENAQTFSGVSRDTTALWKTVCDQMLNIAYGTKRSSLGQHVRLVPPEEPINAYIASRTPSRTIMTSRNTAASVTNRLEATTLATDVKDPYDRSDEDEGQTKRGQE
ncbi:hypothetical protein NM688_g1550 [Phlebia brevispora]|uniref:Uncharacterized protein n=1 Tax=Phlebia brevispora TaxID=194682 RepID=A0ACC1TB64_9APHY|nr:hypothetical protein NM688_g1550 [Phlebia brevispora]